MAEPLSPAAQADKLNPECAPLSQKEAGESLPKRPVKREAISDERGDVEFMRAKANLRASLLRRLGELSASLEGEQDLDRLKKQLDCIEGLLRAFRSLQV
jgi:hypothetical protein